MSHLYKIYTSFCKKRGNIRNGNCLRGESISHCSGNQNGYNLNLKRFGYSSASL